jgi:hypothetical protein
MVTLSSWFNWVPLAALAVVVLILLAARYRRRLLDELASGDTSESCMKFLKNCPDGIDQEVARRTYIAVHDWLLSSRLSVSPDDRFSEDLGIDDEDLADRASLILRSLGKKWQTGSPATIVTMNDLMRYIQNCPSKRSALGSQE